MNILFICNEYPPAPHGGIGAFTEMLANALRARGHHIIIAGIYADTCSDADYTSGNSATVFRVRERKGLIGNFWSRLMLFLLIRRLIRQFRIQLVEVPDFQGLLGFCPSLRVPLIVRLHGTITYFGIETAQPFSRLVYFFERSMLRKASHIVSVSNYVAGKTQQIFNLSSSIETIYNSVDTSVPQTLMVRIPGKVVFSGTLNMKKGIAFLIKAWPSVLALVPTARLHVFGKDTFSNNASFRHQITEGLSVETINSIIFYGHIERSRLLKELETASVAVFPSLSETFGLAPIEAMACGCPTIFTTLSSGPEIIRNHEDGLLVNPQFPDEIAEAVIRLLSNPELAEQYGRRGKMTVIARFALDRIVLENEAMYRRLLSEPLP